MAVEFLFGQTRLDDLQVNPSQTHIFCVNISKWYAETNNDFQKILSENEISHAARFFHSSDRSSYLIRKFCLRLILSKFLSEPAAELAFGLSVRKKPSILGLEFNTSHSGNLAVIAVSPTSIGIDVETIDLLFEYQNIVDYCFNEEEQLLLKASNPLLNFYHLWTRKEAILKASGEGISADMPLVDCLPERVKRKGIEYAITTFRLDAEYIISIASEVSTSSIHLWKLCI